MEIKKKEKREKSMKVGEAVRERIRGLCAERGITINRLATISGITQSTLNNIVGGRNNSATVATIQKICNGLNLSIIEFFDHDLFRRLEQEIE